MNSSAGRCRISGVSVRRKRVEEIENAHDDDDVNETEEEINGDDSFTSAHQGSLFDQSSGGNAVHSDGQAGRRVDQVSMSEIQDAILRALSKCPNNSCTIHSITARVLKELGFVTRGNPREEFEKRVMRSIILLEGREKLEKYKAKNLRVRLIQNVF